MERPSAAVENPKTRKRKRKRARKRKRKITRKRKKPSEGQRIRGSNLSPQRRRWQDLHQRRKHLEAGSPGANRQGRHEREEEHGEEKRMDIRHNSQLNPASGEPARASSAQLQPASARNKTRKATQLQAAQPSFRRASPTSAAQPNFRQPSSTSD